MQYFDGAPTVRDNTVFSNMYNIVNYGGNGAPVVEANSAPLTTW